MSDWAKDARKQGSEEKLAQAVDRLDRHRAGWIAVEIHLSRLRPYHREAHHARIARQTLEALVRRNDASIYDLSSGDFLVLVKGAPRADIEGVVQQLRTLFHEDPLFKDADRGAGDAAFCTWYHLEQDYPALWHRVRWLNEGPRDEPGAREDAPMPIPQSVAPGMTPRQLEQLERAIERADLANLLRRQDIYALFPGTRPEKIYHELYFSMLYLAETILPGFDLTREAWLFRHLTGVLDGRMLALMTRREWFPLLRSGGLNLNVATILSAEFLEFDNETNRSDRGPLAVELPGIDVLNNPAEYLFARDFLRERGYKVVIDGVHHLLLPALDREWLGFDFVKIHWSGNLPDDCQSARGQALSAAIQQIGRERIILCRVDSSAAIEVGEVLGVALYQGRMIDVLAGAPSADSIQVKRV